MGKRTEPETNEYPVPDEIERQYDEATRLLKGYEYKAARAVLLGLLEQFPEEPRILNSLGNTYFAGGDDYNEAERYFLKALRYAPYLSSALSNIASLYCFIGRMEESAEYARRAVEIHPAEAKSWNTLGLYHIRKGQIETALDYFVAAYNYDNEYTIAAYNAACSMVELGRYDEALDYLGKALINERHYHEALQDPAFDPIRENPVFIELMNNARE